MVTYHAGWARPRLRLALAASLLVLLSGCYEKSVTGDQSVYKFAWWVGLLVILGGLVAVPLGLAIRNWSGRWGFALIVMGPVLLIFFAPVMYLDRVVVDSTHFEVRYGFWFAPTKHNIRFDDVREMRYVATRGRKNRIQYELVCAMKGGDTRTVSAGDLVINAVPEILRRAEEKQIPVTRIGP
jgi:hypothetical protein